MKTIPFYQIDAFTNTLFKGNPAGVCPLENWIETELMQKIAAENNLSETAFTLKKITHTILDGLHQLLKLIYAVMPH